MLCVNFGFLYFTFLFEIIESCGFDRIKNSNYYLNQV